MYLLTRQCGQPAGSRRAAAVRHGRHQTLARYISKIILSVFPLLLPASQRGERGSMSSIAARPRQGLLWLVQAIVRFGATFPRRTWRSEPGMATKKATQVQRAVLGGPLPPRPAREIALRCRRYEDHRLTGEVP